MLDFRRCRDRRMGSQGLKEEMCGQQGGECKGGAVVVMAGGVTKDHVLMKEANDNSSQNWYF